MTQAVGCSENQLLYALPGQREEIRSVAERLGVETLLAISQVLDQTAARHAGEHAGPHAGRDGAGADLPAAGSGRPGGADRAAQGRRAPRGAGGLARGAAAAKKNGAVSRPRTPRCSPGLCPAERPTAVGARRSRAAHRQSRRLTTAPTRAADRSRSTTQSAEPVWKRTLDRLTGLVADSAAAANKLSVDAQGRLVASFPDEPQVLPRLVPAASQLWRRSRSALAEVCGGRVGLVLTTHDDPADAAPTRRRGRRSSSSKPRRRPAVRPAGDGAVRRRPQPHSRGAGGRPIAVRRRGDVEWRTGDFHIREDEADVFKGLSQLANLPALLKQAQEMGGKLEQLTAELKTKRVTGAAGGGLVEVDSNGLGEALAVRIDPSLIEKQDRELLEDLLPAAINAAQQKAKELHAESMQQLTGGMNLPGLADALGSLGAGAARRMSRQRAACADAVAHRRDFPPRGPNSRGRIAAWLRARVRTG